MALLELNKVATMAAVCSTAAAVVLACSSSSGTPFMGGGDDASMMTAGEAGAEDAAEATVMPCDGGLVLPNGSAKGGACSDCLKQKCMPALATCAMDCVCTESLECLVVNNNSYTVNVPACMQALTAIAAGNKGLTAIQACLPGSCPVCNETSD